MGRLSNTFSRLEEQGQKALIIYLMAGDPSLKDTEALVLQLEQSGADIIELGVPFSDPIADGPVIQMAAERALRSGTSLPKILELVTHLRTKTQIPLVLMTYYNSLHAMGEAVFCQQAVKAGVDGVIVPDMPPEEATMLQPLAVKEGLDIIYLLAPTSTAQRRKYVAKQSHGFVYYVSLTGITGAKISDLGHVEEMVSKIQREAKQPVAVGFGIATPEDAAQVATFADGVIVGSAVVRSIAEHQDQSDMPKQVGQFVHALKAGMLSR